MNILVCTKITKMDALRHVSWVPNNSTNYAFAVGVPPGTPLGGTYSAPPDLLLLAVPD